MSTSMRSLFPISQCSYEKNQVKLLISDKGPIYILKAEVNGLTERKPQFTFQLTQLGSGWQIPWYVRLGFLTYKMWLTIHIPQCYEAQIK